MPCTNVAEADVRLADVGHVLPRQAQGEIAVSCFHVGDRSEPTDAGVSNHDVVGAAVTGALRLARTDFYVAECGSAAQKIQHTPGNLRAAGTAVHAWSLAWRESSRHPGLDTVLRGFTEAGRTRRWLDYTPQRDWLPDIDHPKLTVHEPPVAAAGVPRPVRRPPSQTSP